MKGFLQLSDRDRLAAFEQCAANRGLTTRSVEKDFWVCVILRELFSHTESGAHLTFKGGTSLSKAWGLIDRFSEDIDLTIDREFLGFGGDHGPEQATSRNEQRRRLERLTQASHDMIAERILPDLRARLEELLEKKWDWRSQLDAEDSEGRTLLFAYPILVEESTAVYVKPIVRLEFGARSDPWPVAQREVTALVAEDFPRLFESSSSLVRALVPERTFWEKVMLLHEERCRPKEKHRRPRMARHYSDVWRRDYTAMQGEMFLGTPPGFDEILDGISRFQDAFNA